MNYFYKAANFPLYGVELQCIVTVDSDKRWHQSKNIQQLPRYTRTEGSPSKPLIGPARGSLRRPPVPKVVVVDHDADATHEAKTPATPYRLPRLHDASAVVALKPKDYVYKQSFTASHFLLKKDPKRSTPVPDCTSPELRIKPNSTKCRPLTQNVRHKIVYQSWPHGDGGKMHRLLPRITQPGGVIVLADSQATEPKTPPQSEAEYNLLPNLAQARAATTSGQIQHNLGPFPVPGETAVERKLNWQLSPYANKNFDRQGLGPNQGPFSREMPIKCMPPNNWLRMKLRQRLVAK
ncbi:unnamed protein product [Clavelina lepadiformis]|uniref:Uncharacterized protein n=1 Tax=Clavelina lepadiformis TaxID=159417 RepID=A0ABP0FX38_CLALP